jgi:hypothetical protein
MVEEKIPNRLKKNAGWLESDRIAKAIAKWGNEAEAFSKL